MFFYFRNYDNDRFEKDGARFKIYAFIGIVVPILLTSLISYKGDRVPGIPNTFLKPKFGRSECSFDRKYFEEEIFVIVELILKI